MLSLEQLKQTNPAYRSNVRLWDYLGRSAAGGVEYRNAGYLRKYLGEDQSPGNQYIQRLLNTPLDNHVASIISIYRSQLFRVSPERKLGLAGEFYQADAFVEDCDLDETDLNDFMRDVNDSLMTYGSVWVCVDKPVYRAATRADELALGIRPYVTMYNPLQVMDWSYERAPNGRYELTYVKIREAILDTHDVIRVWTPDVVYEYHVERSSYAQINTSGNDIGTMPVDTMMIEYGKIIKTIEYVNPLGAVPVFSATIGSRLVRGVGSTPEIEAVADIQRAIYNLCSELEQSIRINSHPSLVKTADTQAAAGAGSIINMPENLSGDLKPFLLQPSTSTVDSILSAIDNYVASIDRLSNLTSVRGAKTMSGIAMETEQQTLNAKLNDMAATLERVEYKIWRLFFAWNQVETPDDFEIAYMKEFNIRDKDREIDRLIKAMAIVPNPLYQAEAMREIVSLTLENDEVIEVIQQSMVVTQDPDPTRGAMTPGETHDSAGEEEEQYVPHVEQMIRDEYTTAEILSMHPEIDADVVDELRHSIES
jgi:hypothetical protein